MNLLTPQSAAKMQETVDEVEKMLKECGVESIEECKRIIKEQKHKENSQIYYSEDLGVFADGLGEMSGEERMDFCKKVGEAGEKFVFGYLVESAEAEGYVVTSRTDNEVKLIKQCGDHTDSVLVYRGDRYGHKQPGWDYITITTVNGAETVKYYEVKTHSTTSEVYNIVRMSDQQMKCAMLNRGNYFVLKVRCDRFGFVCTLDEVFDDIEKCIADGRFSMYEGYTFTVRRKSTS